MIVLIGFMGAGKSTVGRLLADRLGLAFQDVDEVIAQRSELSIPDLFERHGEPHFRDLEQATIVELMQGPESVLDRKSVV